MDGFRKPLKNQPKTKKTTSNLKMSSFVSMIESSSSEENSNVCRNRGRGRGRGRGRRVGSSQARAAFKKPKMYPFISS